MAEAVVAPQTLTGDQLYQTIEEVAAELYKRSLTDLPPDVRQAVGAAFAAEEGRQARMMLKIIQRAVDTSDRTHLIVCQDTGIPVFFVGIGTELAVNGHRLIESLGRGIELATKRHNLRSSIVHPITRENRQTSTGREIPVIHLEFLDGADYLDLQLLPKGSGSENMSFVKMLTPADGLAGVKRFVLDCVVQAGANPCPPTIVGVGLGGSFDKCAELAKRAIRRPVGEPHPEPEIATLERELLEAINMTGIGPQGLGGKTTALAVHIEYAWTHITMNPVAVNLQCWRGERARAQIFADGTISYGY
ncbi:MAG: L(+)-tartrate dehydratase alpha subunit [Thermomicrobiales bacterium]|jgi:fumarate hydratase subunit alpha/L(+)-tartrate dehydratase alpha subunit|nr:L(+)-tartrate dehydratase alpha subunit [Thermomicrobiales bacterium]